MEFVFIILAIFIAIVVVVVKIIIKIVKFILKHFFGLGSDSKEDNMIVKVFVVMAKLTSNLRTDTKLEPQLRSCVELAFNNISKAENSLSAKESLLQAYDSIYPNPISVYPSELKKDLKIFKNKDFQVKKEMIIGLLSLIYVNGKIDKNQDIILDVVKQGIGMSDYDYKRVEVIFGNLMKSGRYGYAWQQTGSRVDDVPTTNHKTENNPTVDNVKKNDASFDNEPLTEIDIVLEDII